MSYLVCHFGKYKSSNVFGLQKHNQRENKNYSNKDLDISKSHLNYDLVNSSPINFRTTINNLIDEKRKSDRAVRKDAVVYCECIISSDQNFFKNLSLDKQKLFFRESLEFLGQKLGKDNIISANVHMDETTPHMHVGFVPIQGDSLSAKKVLNRNFLRNIHNQMPKFLKDNGFDIERGKEDAKFKHMETREYKKLSQAELDDLEFQKKNLNKQIDTLIEKKNSIEKDLNARESLETNLNDINDVEIRKTLLRDKITIKNEDYFKIKNKFENLIKENLEKDNEIANLKYSLNQKNDLINKLNSENKDLTYTLNIRNSEIFDIKEKVIHEKEKEIINIKENFNSDLLNLELEYKRKLDEKDVKIKKLENKRDIDTYFFMEKFIRQQGLYSEFDRKLKIEKRRIEVEEKLRQKEQEKLRQKELEEQARKEFFDKLNKNKERGFGLGL
ncbi:MobV family relaxase [Clostridium baratii]|uniref:MobV family relaxase n=1 Tax=Clostridium baratii TaxID=1561 RepID=UPI0030D5312E